MLTSPVEDVVTFGIHGKIFSLNEFADDDIKDVEDFDFIVDISIALFIGLLFMLLVFKFIKREWENLWNVNISNKIK